MRKKAVRIGRGKKHRTIAIRHNTVSIVVKAMRMWKVRISKCNRGIYNTIEDTYISLGISSIYNEPWVTVSMECELCKENLHV